MTQLPCSWAVAPLLVVSDLLRGVTYTKEVAASQPAPGTLPVLRANNLQGRAFELSELVYVPSALVTGQQRIRSGDVIIATSSGSISVVGKAVQSQTDMDAGFGAFCGVLRPAPTLDARYFGHFFSTEAYRTRVSAMARGSNINNLKREHFEALTFPVAPLPEQRRIADKLDTVLDRVDACRDRLARVAPLLKRFRQSVLAAATTGVLTEDWRRTAPTHQANGDGNDLLNGLQAWKRQWLRSSPQHNEATRVEKRVNAFRTITTTQNGLPANWARACLEDVVLMVVDCHNKTAPYEQEGIPLVRTPNVRDGRFAWEDLRFVSEATYAFWSRRCPPESGDLVFTREAPMGEVAIIPENTRICLGQRTMLIRPIEALFPAKFLQICLMDPRFRERSEGIAVGSGVKHYRVGDVSELVVPIPPASEQGEIIRRVETLFAFADRLEARLTQAKVAVDRLTPSLLAKAFRGELVSQDPADEPAAELLKRLAAQRVAAPPKTRTTRRSQPA